MVMPVTARRRLRRVLYWEHITAGEILLPPPRRVVAEAAQQRFAAEINEKWKDLAADRPLGEGAAADHVRQMAAYMDYFDEHEFCREPGTWRRELDADGVLQLIDDGSANG